MNKVDRLNKGLDEHLAYKKDLKSLSKDYDLTTYESIYSFYEYCVTRNIPVDRISTLVVEISNAKGIDTQSSNWVEEHKKALTKYMREYPYNWSVNQKCK